MRLGLANRCNWLMSQQAWGYYYAKSMARTLSEAGFCIRPMSLLPHALLVGCVITRIGQCCPKTFQPGSNNICTEFSNIHRWRRINSDMESHGSQPNDMPENRDIGGQMSAAPFSCRPCRSRKMKCDRVQPRCGRCTRLKDTCEYPKERRANVGRQKRVRELESKVGQLQWLSDMGRRDRLMSTSPNELPPPPLFCP